MLPRIILIITVIGLGVSAYLYATANSSRAYIARVAFLDVGQGDAIFIETHDGAQMLIDAGGGNTVLRALGREMGFFDRSIDIILATHPDLDHIGGIGPVLSRYQVAAIMAIDLSSDTPAYAAFAAAVMSERSARVNVREGFVVRLSDEVTFEVLSPEGNIKEMETNDASVVGVLHAGEVDFLLMADAPQFVERALVEKYGERLRSEVLKVGHHGSKTSTSPELVDAVEPMVAIISAGKDNRYGHPHQETLNTLAHFDVPFLSTANEGSIIFETDGATFWRK